MSDKALRMIVRDLIGNDSEDWGANVILIDRHVDDLTATIINVVRAGSRPTERDGRHNGNGGARG